MSDAQSGRLDGEAIERGRSTARSMGDKELFELHARGASAFQAGAWEVLDAEVRRRQRVRDRQSAAPHVDEEEAERYPALRIAVILVKVSAVLVLIATILMGTISFRTNAPAAVLIVVVGILATISYWAGAELLVVLMDIEANTRFLRRDRQ